MPRGKGLHYRDIEEILNKPDEVDRTRSGSKATTMKKAKTKPRRRKDQDDRDIIPMEEEELEKDNTEEEGEELHARPIIDIHRRLDSVEDNNNQLHEEIVELRTAVSDMGSKLDAIVGLLNDKSNGHEENLKIKKNHHKARDMDDSDEEESDESSRERGRSLKRGIRKKEDNSPAIRKSSKSKADSREKVKKSHKKSKKKTKEPKKNFMEEEENDSSENEISFGNSGKTLVSDDSSSDSDSSSDEAHKKKKKSKCQKFRLLWELEDSEDELLLAPTEWEDLDETDSGKKKKDNKLKTIRKRRLAKYEDWNKWIQILLTTSNSKKKDELIIFNGIIQDIQRSQGWKVAEQYLKLFETEQRKLYYQLKSGFVKVKLLPYNEIVTSMLLNAQTLVSKINDSSNRRAKVTCFHCGGVGHVKSKCPKLNESKGKNFHGKKKSNEDSDKKQSKCHKCGGIGHLKENCPSKSD